MSGARVGAGRRRCLGTERPAIVLVLWGGPQLSWTSHVMLNDAGVL